MPKRVNIDLQSFLQGHNFTQCALRPPAIGEENEVTSVDGRMSTHSSVSGKSEVSSATPRRTDIDLGFEPEGSASPLPACEKWKLSLHNMLEDSDGIKLFQVFLADSKQKEVLDCWLACKGFRDFFKNNCSNNSSAASSTTGPLHSQRQMDCGMLETRGKLAKMIYNTYFKKDKCGVVSSIIKDATRQYICKQIKNALQAQKDSITSGGYGDLDTGLFDQAQNEIERNVEGNSYIAFLNSDLFRKYAAQCETKHHKQAPTAVSNAPQHGHENKNYSSNTVSQQIPSESTPSAPGRYIYLPPLHENRVWHPPNKPRSEVISEKEHQSPSTASQSSLTRRALENSMASRYSNVADQSPYLIAGSARYYVPPASANVSDQASSDATSDTLSVTDGSVDGSSVYSSKKNQKRIMRHQYKRNVAVHYQEEDNFVPLTRRCNGKQQMATIATERPAEFFAQLKWKLEKVIEDRRKEEALNAPDDSNDILDMHLERVMKTPVASNSPHGRQSPTPAMAHAVQDVLHDARRYHHQQKDANEQLVSLNRFSLDQSLNSRRTDSLKRRSKEIAIGMAPNQVPDVRTPIDPVNKTHMIAEWIKQSNNKTMQQSTGMAKRKGSIGKASQTGLYINPGTVFPVQAIVTSKDSQPLQPMASDQDMPPLDQPDVNTTMEEVKRRLIEEAERKDSYNAPLPSYLALHGRNGLGSSLSSVSSGIPSSMTTGFHSALSSSSGATLQSESFHDNRSMTSAKSDSSGSKTTTCVYYINIPSESIAYKIHLPYHPVTLGQFKSYLSKKGHFRYFFKQFSPEIGGPVFFEIQKENDVLPLWENTIVAKLEPYNS